MSDIISLLIWLVPSLILVAIIVLVVLGKVKMPKGMQADIDKHYGTPKIFDELPNHFQGSVSYLSLSAAASFKGQTEGYDFSLEFSRRRRSAKNDFYLTLHYGFNSKLSIYIYNENRGPAFNAEKFKTGDRNFDELFTTYSNLPDKAKQLFYDETNRRIILHLKELGWSLPKIRKDDITVSISVTNQELIDSMFIKETLKDMVALTENIKKQVVHTH